MVGSRLAVYKHRIHKSKSSRHQSYSLQRAIDNHNKKSSRISSYFSRKEDPRKQGYTRLDLEKGTKKNAKVDEEVTADLQIDQKQKGSQTQKKQSGSAQKKTIRRVASGDVIEKFDDRRSIHSDKGVSFGDDQSSEDLIDAKGLNASIQSWGGEEESAPLAKNEKLAKKSTEPLKSTQMTDLSPHKKNQVSKKNELLLKSKTLLSKPS